ncbi:MAG TPA: LysE family translocator [Nocardioidaceae bacterium]|nr:LysE family translocator [Nocardioidaceae bacterium]
MTLSTLLVFAGALLLVAGSPGPSVAAMVARVLTRGLRSVLPFLVAMWVGEAIWLTLAVTGLASIAQTFHVAFLVLKYVGVAYLLYLAWGMWTASADPGTDSLPNRQGGWSMFGAGMTVTLGNPKIMAFYLALLPTIVDIGGIGPSAYLGMLATMLVVLAAVDLGWALLAAKGRTLLRNRRAVRVANRTSAGVMVGAALVVARP